MFFVDQDSDATPSDMFARAAANRSKILSEPSMLILDGLQSHKPAGIVGDKAWSLNSRVSLTARTSTKSIPGSVTAR